MRAFTVIDADDAPAAIAAAWDHPDSALIDFRVEREANVFPMVPAGRSIGEMMLGHNSAVPAAQL